MSLDHLTPEERVALAGVAPLRAPETGAEALLLTARPEDARQVLCRALERLERLRDEAAELMEHLLQQLDRIDGDPDLEPSLCTAFHASAYSFSDGYAPGYECTRHSQLITVEGCGEVDLEEGCDLEPSLGSMSNRIDQRFWALAGGEETPIGEPGEVAHDGREPCCEDEGAQCEDEGSGDDDCDLTEGGARWFTHDGKTTWPPPVAMEEALAQQQNDGGIRSWNLPPAERTP
jgi:hypothetical protein